MRMPSNEKIALICEGAAEHAIMQLLLNNDDLMFRKEDLFYEKILRCRNGATFAKEYLGSEFDFKVIICRILDSRKERFSIPKEYATKIAMPEGEDSFAYNFFTRPEIEMLHIIAHGDYDDSNNKCNRGKNGKLKPSQYVQTNYKDMEHYKGYNDNYRYWGTNYGLLKATLKQYKQKSRQRSGEYCIADLLK